MTNAKSVAALVGPFLVALAITEAMNLHLWTGIDPSMPVYSLLVYFNGTLVFLAGLSILRAYNRWTRGWPVLVTLTGWFGIFGGLVRMTAPVGAQQNAHQSVTSIYALLVVLLAVGVVLTFKAYGRQTTEGR